MKSATPRSGCPVSFALDFLGDKWTLLILRDMFLHDKRSYREFLKSDEGIATNILGNRLEMLEAQGFITSEIAPTNKSKVIYTLTAKALDLLPVMVEMSLWGAKHNPANDFNEPIHKEIRKDKALAIKKYTDMHQARLKQA